MTRRDTGGAGAMPARQMLINSVNRTVNPAAVDAYMRVNTPLLTDATAEQCARAARAVKVAAQTHRGFALGIARTAGMDGQFKLWELCRKAGAYYLPQGRGV